MSAIGQQRTSQVFSVCLIKPGRNGEQVKFLMIALLFMTQFASKAYCQESKFANGSFTPPTTARLAQLPPPVDYEFAWDEFAHLGEIIWACRGVQSGKFVALEWCDLKPKVDYQWPSKSTPGQWKPW
jgi:hypothetical protein